MNRRIARVAALAAVLALVSAPSFAQNPGKDIKVDRLEFPVTLPDGSHQTIVGYLYYQGSYRNRPLQVVVHGATYNHSYWDFPAVNGEAYSYARYMAASDRKYAVLAVDQLAAGESSHPADGLSITLVETATALKQVIDRMRSGDNALGYGFTRIVLVGHSSGSVNATFVQAQWHSADALVLTAARHTTSLPFSPGVSAVLPFVPFLASLPYFQLPLDLRAQLFFYGPGADAAVVAADNAAADFWTGGQVLSTFAAFLYPLAAPEIDGVSRVRGPVFIQLGEFDALFPAGDAAAEAALWLSTTPTIQTVAGVGHDFNLHRNRAESWAGIAGWLATTLDWRD
jgi:pimeloyl-ACP methyl ester carboxylesterase